MTESLLHDVNRVALGEDRAWVWRSAWKVIRGSAVAFTNRLKVAEIVCRDR